MNKEKLIYVSPVMEFLEVMVEQGFAMSGDSTTEDFGSGNGIW